MNLTEIEAELGSLTPEELRRLALRAWREYVDREGKGPSAVECSEDNSSLLAALDEAIAELDQGASQGCSAEEVRDRLRQWTSSE